MDLERIASVIDVVRMGAAHVTVVGSAPTLVQNLFRCGLGKANIVDPQTIEPSNIARQDYLATAIGLSKVEAIAEQVHRINANAVVNCLRADFCAFSDADLDRHFGHSHLLIAATDHFPAQARVNELALRRNIPALFVGLYPRATVGELAYWEPWIDSCFRCLCSKRYAAHERARSEGRSVDPPSDGADIFSIQLLDAIAGQLAVASLTRGSSNRFGSLVDQLGTGPDARNFLQIKIDPAYTFGGRDIFREHLMIPGQCESYFTWTTIARRDDLRASIPCRDCTLYRGHYWLQSEDETWRRMKPTVPGNDEEEARQQRDALLVACPVSPFVR